MKQKILSLFLALSISAGLFPVVSSAENTEDILMQEQSENTEDILMHEQSEDIDYEMFMNSGDMSVAADNAFEIQEEKNEDAVLFAANTESAGDVSLSSDSTVKTLEEYDAQLAAIAQTSGSTDAADLAENEE